MAVEVTSVRQFVNATASAHKANKICHFIGVKKRKKQITAVVCVFYEKRSVKNEIFSGREGTKVCMASTEENEKVLGLTWSSDKAIFELYSDVVIETKVSTKQYTSLNDLKADSPEEVKLSIIKFYF